MCLSKIEDFPVTQNYGWQVFEEKKTTGELFSCFFGGDPIPVGKWQRDKIRIFARWIYITRSRKYKTGFHIFLNEEDAKEYCPDSEAYCMRKVRFKRVVVRGLQEIPCPAGGRIQTRWVEVVVCRKRFVEPN